MGRAAPDIPDGMRGSTVASHDGGSPIPGDCRFRIHCGQRQRRWPESTGYSEPPKF